MKKSKLIKDKRVISGWDEVVKLRNKVMHGEEEQYEPLVTWQQNLRLLVDFMGTYQQFCTLVSQVLSGSR